MLSIINNVSVDFTSLFFRLPWSVSVRNASSKNEQKECKSASRTNKGAVLSWMLSATIFLISTWKAQIQHRCANCQLKVKTERASKHVGPCIWPIVWHSITLYIFEWFNIRMCCADVSKTIPNILYNGLIKVITGQNVKDVEMLSETASKCQLKIKMSTCYSFILFAQIKLTVECFSDRIPEYLFVWLRFWFFFFSFCTHTDFVIKVWCVCHRCRNSW